MSESKEPGKFNLPNLLSGYRLLSFPYLLYLIYSNQQHLFSVLLCVNLVTDILDGLIARIFNLQTSFGARLDSLADIGTYILAFSGVLVFKSAELGSYLFLLYTFLATWLTGNIYSFIKFKKFPSLHLYSAKIGGYLQGIFFFVLFMFQFVNWLFMIALVWGILSWLEELWVLSTLNELRSDVKGMYWIKKKQHES